MSSQSDTEEDFFVRLSYKGGIQDVPKSQLDCLDGISVPSDGILRLSTFCPGTKKAAVIIGYADTIELLEEKYDGRPATQNPIDAPVATKRKIKPKKDTSFITPAFMRKSTLHSAFLNAAKKKELNQKKMAKTSTRESEIDDLSLIEEAVNHSRSRNRVDIQQVSQKQELEQLLAATQEKLRAIQKQDTERENAIVRQEEDDDIVEQQFFTKSPKLKRYKRLVAVAESSEDEDSENQTKEEIEHSDEPDDEMTQFDPLAESLEPDLQDILLPAQNLDQSPDPEASQQPAILEPAVQLQEQHDVSAREVVLEPVEAASADDLFLRTLKGIAAKFKDPESQLLHSEIDPLRQYVEIGQLSFPKQTTLVALRKAATPGQVTGVILKNGAVAEALLAATCDGMEKKSNKKSSPRIAIHPKLFDAIKTKIMEIQGTVAQSGSEDNDDSRKRKGQKKKHWPSDDSSVTEVQRFKSDWPVSCTTNKALKAVINKNLNARRIKLKEDLKNGAD